MIKKKIIKAIASLACLKPEEISPEDFFVQELQFDSLDYTELAINLEDEFNIDEIPDKDLENIKTVQDMVDYIISKTSPAADAPASPPNPGPST